MNEYQEQQAIEQIALAHFPDTTGVKEIKPFIMADEKEDYWLVILTTTEEFVYQTTLVTKDDGLSGVILAKKYDVPYN